MLCLLLHCFLPRNLYVLLLTFLNYVHVPRSPAHLYLTLHSMLAHHVFFYAKVINIYVVAKYVIQLKCNGDGIISFVFAMMVPLLHLLNFDFGVLLFCESLPLLRSESLSVKSVKLYTVAARNSKDHMPPSFYYCLFVPHICMGVAFHTSRLW